MRSTCALLAVAVVSTFPSSLGAQPERIDFEDLLAGTVVHEVFGDLGSGPIFVDAVSSELEGNVALIFDSASPTGGDHDLGTPNVDFGGPGLGSGGELGAAYPNDEARGHVMIIAENLVDSDGDGLIDDPDDAALVGSEISFDFSELGSVEIERITILDVEETEQASTVEFFDHEGVSLGIAELPKVGNNGYAAVDIEPLGRVTEMIVTLNGSGAIDDVEFEAECNLEFAASRRTARPGDTVDLEIRLTHRNPALSVPFSSWLERADGSVVKRFTSKPFAMDYGDVVEVERSFRLPVNAPSGEYFLVVGTERMKQGIAWRRLPLTIEE